MVARSEAGRVRLSTLMTMRWIALAAQAATLLVVKFGLGFDLPLGAALAIIALAALLNLEAAYVGNRWRRLNETQAVAYLGFDILQLAALLYLTGGIQNPFSVLLLAPVTAGSAILSRRNILWLIGLAYLVIGFLALWFHPLPWSQGGLELPAQYRLGAWLALTISTGFIGLYAWFLTSETRRLNDALQATQFALAAEQQLTALGALAAATAHELGTPLSTIALVARELQRDTPPGSPHAEDIALLISQSERCRTILADLSRRPEQEGIPLLDSQPLSIILQNIAKPYLRMGLDFMVLDTTADSEHPVTFSQTPELKHGLANILQNGLQFAHSRLVATISREGGVIRCLLEDDGPGFPPAFLERLGEPYLSSRSEHGIHLGLGLFIARTLLAQTGATLAFANHPQKGAMVTVTWPDVKAP